MEPCLGDSAHAPCSLGRADEPIRVGLRVGPLDDNTAESPAHSLFEQLCVAVQHPRDGRFGHMVTSPFSSPMAEVVQAITQQFHIAESVPSSTTPKNSDNTAATSSSPTQAPSSAEPDEGAQTSKCSLTATASCLLNLSQAAANGCAAPPHGVKAVCGKRAKMEDAFSVQPNFADVLMSPADASFQNKLPARIALQIVEQLETCSPPVSQQFSPQSPNSTCAPCLSSSDTEASVGGSSSASTSASSAATSDAASSCLCDTLHFFGVYDGHGGVEAAQHCANRLHYHLSVALAQVVGAGTMHTHDAFCVAGAMNGDVASSLQCQSEWNFCSHDEPSQVAAEAPATASKESQGVACRCCSPQEPCSSCKAACDAAAGPSAQAATAGDEEASQPLIPALSVVCEEQEQEPGQQQGDEGQDGCDNASNGDAARSEGSAQCMTAALEGALRDAFLKTDEEFAEDGSSAMVGSTAVVALVGTKKMWIANCGDSRAVLCRGGKAIQVTDDHKPEREDEAERVEKAGGQVLYWNGHRVMGVLAMSRAIGDHGLRPYVIPEPEITVLARVQEDDFLLLASDGLWDVMSNQEAITLAMRCLQRSWDKGTSRKAAVRVAATVLTRAAVDRGSKDNVTVVIIDLKAPQPTSSDGKQECAAGTCDPACSVQPGSISSACDTAAAAAAATSDRCGAECKGEGEGLQASLPPPPPPVKIQGEPKTTQPVAKATGPAACGACAKLPEPWANVCAAAAAAAAAAAESGSAGPSAFGGLSDSPMDSPVHRQDTIVLRPELLAQARQAVLMQQDTLLCPALLDLAREDGRGACSPQQGEGQPVGELPEQITLESPVSFADIESAGRGGSVPESQASAERALQQQITLSPRGLGS